MELTTEVKREILRYVMEHYFTETRIEGLVLECIGNNSIAEKFTPTQDIRRYLEKQGIATSSGAVRGTVLRIRHKLFKYREQTREHAFHLIFPEQTSRKGYRLNFERNPNHRVITEPSRDPWLSKNWRALRKQGYRGLWRGLSLPDGGKWPIKLYVWITSVRNEKKKEEKFMGLIDSPSSTKHRIAILEGEIKDEILCMEGEWCVHNPETGLEHFHLSAKLWPFRKEQHEPVKISGRFILSHEKRNEYQEGQIELDYCPSQSLPTVEEVEE